MRKSVPFPTTLMPPKELNTFSPLLLDGVIPGRSATILHRTCSFKIIFYLGITSFSTMPVISGVPSKDDFEKLVRARQNRK